MSGSKNQDVDHESKKYVKNENMILPGRPSRTTVSSCIQPQSDIRYAIKKEVYGCFFPEEWG